MRSFVCLPLLAAWLLVPPAALRGQTVRLVVYAVEARVADQIAPEVAGEEGKLAEFLASKKAPVALDLSGELRWATMMDLSEGKEIEYFQRFEGSGEAMKGTERGTRFIGCKAECRALRSTDGRARIEVKFDWTPSFQKVAIAGGGEDIWLPRFHTLRASNSRIIAENTPSLAATWRVSFPLSEQDKGGLRQLYLFATWTGGPDAE